MVVETGCHERQRAAEEEDEEDEEDEDTSVAVAVAVAAAAAASFLDVRLLHILEKESMCLIQKVDQKRVVYARYHAGEVETKLNPAVAGCVLLFQKGLYSLL